MKGRECVTGYPDSNPETPWDPKSPIYYELIWLEMFILTSDANLWRCEDEILSNLDLPRKQVEKKG